MTASRPPGPAASDSGSAEPAAALIPLVDRSDLDEFGRSVWDEIEGARGDVPTSYRSLLNSPRIAHGVGVLGSAIRFGSQLDPKLRELAVLVVNCETGCDFGWEHHVVLARGMGISAEIIAELRAGRTPQGISGAQQLAVRAAKQLSTRTEATPDVVNGLVAELGREQTTELIVAIGYYLMLSRYFLTLRLTVEPERLDHLTHGRDVVAATDDDPNDPSETQPTKP